MYRLLPIVAWALFFSPFAAAQQCPCSAQLDFLTQKIEQNYAGFRDKVNDSTKTAYAQHTDRYRQRCATAKSDTACLRLMTEWGTWFRDRHIYMVAIPTPEKPEDIRKRFANVEKIELSEAAAKAWLDKDGRDSLEGIWQNEDGTYRVAIVQHRTPNRQFAAVILRADSIWWVPGQVKFSLRGLDEEGAYPVHYFMRDHSGRVTRANMNGTVLSIKDIGTWYKVYPGNIAPPPPPGLSAVYTLKRLDDSTLVLRIPTMNEQYRKELKHLEKQHRNALKRAPYLILDCRGNGGGSDITYGPLKKYLYTGPARFARKQTYATPDNIQKYTLLKNNKNYPWLYRRFFARTERRLKRHEGKMVGKTKPFVERHWRRAKRAQKVAVIMDNGCASSCEGFVAFARQSKKVTLMGQNTAGISDYGNLHNLIFPCGLWKIYYPTSRSCAVSQGQGIDNIGYAPTLRIGPEIPDWIAFARTALKNK